MKDKITILHSLMTEIFEHDDGEFIGIKQFDTEDDDPDNIVEILFTRKLAVDMANMILEMTGEGKD